MVNLMNNDINNQIIDQLEIVWDDARQRVRVLNCARELRVIRDYFSRSHASTLMYIARAVRDQENMGINGSGFRYAHNELDPNEEPFEGVEIYDPFDELYVTQEAFDGLMNGFFSALRKGAKKALAKEPWWKEFVDISLQIEKRVTSSGKKRDSRRIKRTISHKNVWKTGQPLPALGLSGD